MFPATCTPPWEGDGSGTGRPWPVIVLKDDQNTFQTSRVLFEPGVIHEHGMALAHRIHMGQAAVVGRERGPYRTQLEARTCRSCERLRLSRDARRSRQNAVWIAASRSLLEGRGSPCRGWGPFLPDFYPGTSRTAILSPEFECVIVKAGWVHLVRVETSRRSGSRPGTCLRTSMRGSGAAALRSSRVPPALCETRVIVGRAILTLAFFLSLLAVGCGGEEKVTPPPSGDNIVLVNHKWSASGDWGAKDLVDVRISESKPRRDAVAFRAGSGTVARFYGEQHSRATWSRSALALTTS